MSNTWTSDIANFTATWKLQDSPSFEIVPGSSAGTVEVKPWAARGLISNTSYVGRVDPQENGISLVFTLRADGLDGDRKKLRFESAVTGAKALEAVSEHGGAGDWGAKLEDFDGTWNLPALGKLIIKHGTQIQCIEVLGLDGLVYDGRFNEAEKSLEICFVLSNHGYLGENSENPKEILYQFPEVRHLPDENVPVEGERYEEVASGSGGY